MSLFEFTVTDKNNYAFRSNKITLLRAYLMNRKPEVETFEGTISIRANNIPFEGFRSFSPNEKLLSMVKNVKVERFNFSADFSIDPLDDYDEWLDNLICELTVMVIGIPTDKYDGYDFEIDYGYRFSWEFTFITKTIKITSKTYENIMKYSPAWFRAVVLFKLIVGDPVVITETPFSKSGIERASSLS